MKMAFAFLLLFATIGCCLLPGSEEEDTDDQAEGQPQNGAYTAPSVGGTATDAPPASMPPPPPPVAPGAPPGRLTRASFVGSPLAPQAPGAAALFGRSAARTTGPIEDGLLVCSATVRGNWDDSFFAGGADVALLVRFGEGAAQRATAQNSLRMYTFPISRLTPGESMWVRVIDRDVLSDDTIGEDFERFESAPFTLNMEHADIECRAVDPALVRDRVATAVASLTRAVNALTAATPDVSAYDLGYPSAAAERVIAAAQEVAPWSEGRSREHDAQIERAVGFDAEWERRARAAVDAAMTELPPPGESVAIGGARTISVREVLCGLDATARREAMGEASIDSNTEGCLVVLALAASRRTTLPALEAVDAQWDEVWGLDASARMLGAHIAARARSGAYLPTTEPVVLTPGEPIDVVVSLPRTSQAALLRVRDGGRAVLLRLE